MYEVDGNPTNCRKCGEEGCWRTYYARGVCYHHYLRWYRGLPPKQERQRLPESFKVFRG